MLNSATVTISDMVKASETQVEIGYDDRLECEDSPSGFYIDYRDEINIRVKDDDGKEFIIFGGYVSSILPDDNRTKLTIHGASRLTDGENRYVLDKIALYGGTSDLASDEYEDGMTKQFENYGHALKYLCDLYENTLVANIPSAFTDGGEKYQEGFTITYGTKKLVKSIKTSNGESTAQKNFITIRNKPSSAKKQVWKLYDAKEHSKLPIDITRYGYMHITYGMGNPKTDHKKEVTEKADVSDEVAGTQKFNKCGVSQDGKYIMAVGLPSACGEVGKYGYKYYKRVYKRKCKCGSTNLIWDWHWVGTSDYGYSSCRGNKEGGSAEGHIFCKSCDRDYSILTGKDHKYCGSPNRLEPVSKLVKSSESEARKLKNGKVVAVPATMAEITSDDIFKAITNIAFKYKYDLHGGSQTYTGMKKSGRGDCWAFSDLIFTELKKYGVSCKIKQYRTQYSDAHRSVIYKNAEKKWVDFPYRQYGWGTKYKNMLNNTSSSMHGSTIKANKGTNIGNIKVGSKSTTQQKTTTVTTTKGYDTSKPFQGYLKLVYSTEQSYNSKKYAVYVKFTYDSDNDNTVTGLNLYWVNKSVKKSTLRINGEYSLVDYIRSIQGQDAKVYLHSIHMIAPKRTPKDKKEDVNWYKYDDSTIDNSSCKLDLYQIVFNDDKNGESTDLNSGGKTVNAMIKELVEDTGYIVNMEYSTHRCDDRINFNVNNKSNISFTAMEGDDNNILGWNSISYAPISSLYNKSICVYKGVDNMYHYVDSSDMSSILRYGEQTTLQTSNNQTSPTEAYFNARMSDKFNSEETYNFTITVPNCPNVQLGDYVQVIGNAKKLNTIKEVQSLKLTFSNSKMPRIQTELGLGELAPDIQMKKNIRELRKEARKETTSFDYNSAIPTDSKELYKWEFD